MSLALGTGAFTSVSAERSVTIDTADDAYAFLRLNERGGGERSEIDGGTLVFNIPGDDESGYPSENPTDPEGLGTDSVYRFGEDAAHDEAGLFAIRNQGTQPVNVYSTQRRPKVCRRSQCTTSIPEICSPRAVRRHNSVSDLLHSSAV